jgi:hypothetical protein
MNEEVGLPCRKIAVVAEDELARAPVSMYAILESRTGTWWRVKGKSDETEDSGGWAIASTFDFEDSSKK